MMEKLFEYPADNIPIQMFRYVLAGALAYAVDYGALAMLTNAFKVYYLTSAAIAFMLGAVISYILSITWVFNERTFKDRRLEASIFISIGIMGLFLNHYCMWFFTETVNLHYLSSKFISTIAVFAVNFSARKFILFR